MINTPGALTSKAEETRQRIYNSALELFRENGFEETTMRQIAAKSRVALGAAYYYFRSKEALVMAFYERAQTEMEPLLIEALAREKGLAARLREILEVKFRYFGPNRSLLGALSAHADPSHPLSPFSRETESIRQRDVAFFAQALDGANVRVPADLKRRLPWLLWLYQMGVLLYWVYDSSPDQVRTRQLVEKTLVIVTRLIQLSGLALLRPLRRRVTELLELVAGKGGTSGSAGREL